jgi:hypothetical protein
VLFSSLLGLLSFSLSLFSFSAFPIAQFQRGIALGAKVSRVCGVLIINVRAGADVPTTRGKKIPAAERRLLQNPSPQRRLMQAWDHSDV